ncbi:MAG: pitrilysin family protein [Spirochaetaceae bacterium]|nr:pitrilysin family protein [Spirochaetaceae bacterium]
MIQEFELSLGATLLVDPVEHTGTAALGFWYGHGSRDERAHEHGCSHLLEHMVFKGTPTRSATQIAREIDRVGGAINAFTDRECTCLYCSVPGSSAPAAAAVLADLATAPTLDTDELAKERQIVINEVQAADDSPDERAYQAYVERLWGTHELSRRIAGEIHEIAEIDRDLLYGFFRERFHPSRLVISVAGRIAIDEVVAAIEEALTRSAGTWLGDTAHDQAERSTPADRAGIWQEMDSCHQTYLYGGRSLPVPRTVRNYYALTLLSTLTGESMSSRLFQNLRERRGLCYSIGSFRTHFSDVWLWSVFANCVPEAREELIDCLRAELRGLRAHPPEREEIDEAASHLRGALVFAREDMEARMRRMVYQRQTFGPILSFEEMDSYIHGVGPDELQAMAGLVADTDAFAFVAYGGDPIEHDVEPQSSD